MPNDHEFDLTNMPSVFKQFPRELLIHILQSLSDEALFKMQVNKRFRSTSEYILAQRWAEMSDMDFICIWQEQNKEAQLRIIRILQTYSLNGLAWSDSLQKKLNTIAKQYFMYSYPSCEMLASALIPYMSREDLTAVSEVTRDTPTQRALDVGQDEVALMIMRRLNDIDLKVKNRYQETYLHRAARSGCEQSIQYLLEHGVPHDERDLFNETALCDALVMEHDGCARTLINWGSQEIHEYRNNFGVSYLHLAAIHHCLESLQYLLKLGADPNTQDQEGDTPLHDVLGIINYSQVINLLLAYGADLSIRNNKDEMPLHVFAKFGYCEYLAALIEHGADLNAPCLDVNNALNMALFFRHDDAALMMYKHMYNDRMLIMNYAGASPLHFAAFGNCPQTLGQLMIDFPELIDAQNLQEDTPLHLALRHKNVTCMQQLIHAGARIDIKNNEGMLPSDIAIQKDLLETFQSAVAARDNNTQVSAPVTFQYDLYSNRNHNRTQGLASRSLLTTRPSATQSSFRPVLGFGPTP